MDHLCNLWDPVQSENVGPLFKSQEFRTASTKSSVGPVGLHSQEPALAPSDPHLARLGTRTGGGGTRLCSTLDSPGDLKITDTCSHFHSHLGWEIGFSLGDSNAQDLGVARLE